MSNGFDGDAGRDDIADLIAGQAEALSQKLQAHRLKLFPPSAEKPLRAFGPAKAAKFRGITSGYLKNLSLEGKGPVPRLSPSWRRSYTAEQIRELRGYLEEYGPPGRHYMPRRRGNEHLQIIAVVNFKGGSCKTTTTAYLAQHLALRGICGVSFNNLVGKVEDRERH
jgi:chromosome partitioning protein